MIAVVDYGMGNLASICKGLAYVGGDPVITSNPAEVVGAAKIVLPGVGAFGDGMAHLKQMGMDQAIRTALTWGTPFLGICLGMQLLAKKSYEFGEYNGLGLLDAEVVKFDFASSLRPLSVPHVGWNVVKFNLPLPLFADIPNYSDFYFVHSYHLVCHNPGLVAAECDYGGPFVAAVAKEKIFAIQFHPEKSQRWGLQLLKNFVTLC